MFSEDLSFFLEDFGVDCTFTRNSTPVASAKLILDNLPVETGVYDRSFYDEKFYSAKVLGRNIVLYAIASEVADVRPNDTATINGTAMYVHYIEPDGTGMTLIHLSFDRG